MHRKSALVSLAPLSVFDLAPADAAGDGKTPSGKLLSEVATQFELKATSVKAFDFFAGTRPASACSHSSNVAAAVQI